MPLHFTLLNLTIILMIVHFVVKLNFFTRNEMCTRLHFPKINKMSCLNLWNGCEKANFDGNLEP